MPSRAIRAFDYDAERHELTVAFASGRTYVYSLVPSTVVAAFATSPSPGAFHNTHIRNRYPYRKVATRRSAASLREQLAASAEAEAEPTAVAAPSRERRRQPSSSVNAAASVTGSEQVSPRQT